MKRVLIAAVVFGVFFGTAFAAEKTDFTDLKSKIGIGCSVTGSGASVRIWPTDDLGAEFTIGLRVAADYVNLPVSAVMLFPLLKKGNFSIIAAPGLGFTYLKSSAVSSGFIVAIGANLLLEMELPMISDNLSIGSGIGASFNINSTAVTGAPSSTTFDIDLVTVKPLFIRYYF